MSGARQRGYAMFLAAVVVAILAFVLLAVARVQAGFSPAVRTLNAQMERDLVAESLAARVTFLLLAEPIGPRSVVIGGPRAAGAASAGGMMNGRRSEHQTQELRLDGRLYLADDAAGRERAFVGVQDETGLFDLNSPDEAAAGSLLEQLGLPAGGARRLAAALVDYTDGDDLTRADGAEANSYARLGLPTPPNRAMTSRWQALEVLGWRERLSPGQKSTLWRLVSAGAQQQMLNLNTAPIAVLEAALGDARAAAALDARRQASELRDLQEVETLTAGRARAAGASFALRPATAFRLVILFGEDAARADVGVERRIVLAGQEAERPFYSSEERRGRIGAGRRQDRGDQTQPLPYSAAQPAS